MYSHTINMIYQFCLCLDNKINSYNRWVSVRIIPTITASTRTIAAVTNIKYVTSQPMCTSPKITGAKPSLLFYAEIPKLNCTKSQKLTNKTANATLTQPAEQYWTREHAKIAKDCRSKSITKTNRLMNLRSWTWKSKRNRTSYMKKTGNCRLLSSITVKRLIGLWSAPTKMFVMKSKDILKRVPNLLLKINFYSINCTKLNNLSQYLKRTTKKTKERLLFWGSKNKIWLMPIVFYCRNWKKVGQNKARKQ